MAEVKKENKEVLDLTDKKGFRAKIEERKEKIDFFVVEKKKFEAATKK